MGDKIRRLDLRHPDVVAAEQAANAAWSAYWASLLYGVNWHPAKVSIIREEARPLAAQVAH